MSEYSVIHSFFADAFPGAEISSTAGIHTGGSDRNYYRISDEHFNSFILVQSTQIEENRDFLTLTRILLDAEVAVPRIIRVSDDESMYLLTDLGSTDLLGVVTSTDSDTYMPLYRGAIAELVQAQKVLGGSQKEKLLEQHRIYSSELVLHDLMYFLYDFVKISGLEFDPYTTLSGLSDWVSDLADFKVMSFMYRDFQSRNVMVYRDRCYLIDYQGGLWGPVAYDMASLLYQARAGLSDQIRTQLWEYYCQQYLASSPDVDVQDLEADYQKCIFLRLVQVLGAYGYRGLVQQKAHFVESIPPALLNLKMFLNQNPNFFIPKGFHTVLQRITQDDYISKF